MLLQDRYVRMSVSDNSERINAKNKIKESLETA